MYAGVPITRRRSRVAPATRAMPKSSTRALPSAPTITLWGETSPWTRPSGMPVSLAVSWAACSPSSTPVITADTTGSGTGAWRRRAAPSRPPSVSPCT